MSKYNVGDVVTGGIIVGITDPHYHLFVMCQQRQCEEEHMTEILNQAWAKYDWKLFPIYTVWLNNKQREVTIEEYKETRFGKLVKDECLLEAYELDVPLRSALFMPEKALTLEVIQEATPIVPKREVQL